MRDYVQNKKELAENLKFIRECLNMSQKKIADMLEIDRSTYTYYETGKTQPDLFTIIRLSEIFNIDVVDLITKDGLKKV